MGAKLVEIRISSDSSFGEGTNDDEQLYYPKTIVNQIVNLLDEQGKINLNLLPSFVFGGQTYLGDISGTPSIASLFERICQDANALEIDDINKFAGRYFQASTDTTITIAQLSYTNGSHPAISKYTGLLSGILTFNVEPDDGVIPTSTLTLETNDYLVFKRFDDDTDGGTAWFGVVNNTYTNASTTETGVVRLASDTDIINGIDTSKAVTPAGAKLAVQTHGYKHPTIAPDIDVLTGAGGRLRVISQITLSSDGNHIAAIGTTDIPFSNFNQKGLVQNITNEQAKSTDLTSFAEGYAVSPPIAKTMIEHYGKIDYFPTLAEANASPVKNVSGKLVLVGV